MNTHLQTLLSLLRIGGSAIHLSRKGVSLARRVIEELVDDLDGEAASETITFSYRGADYEVAAARKVGARRATRASATVRSKNAPNPRDVREWAKRNGIAVSDRGRVPTGVVQQCQGAH